MNRRGAGGSGGRAAVALAAVTLALALAAARAEGYDWPQFNGDAAHSGNNTREQALNHDTVGRLGLQYQVPLPDTADGAPIYIEKVESPRGRIDILVVATRDGHVLGLDALTGAAVWVRENPARGCRINEGSRPCYTTASPAADPKGGFVYCYGLDGYVHKYRLGDGEEAVGGGWPALTTLKPFNEKGSSNLSIATAAGGRTYLLAAHAGYPGDRGDYQGHLTVIDLADGSQRVFNANCSGEPVHFRQKPAVPDCTAVRSAIWARAGAVYSSSLDRIYVATGNGPFAPSRRDWGDSVLCLHPDGTGRGADPLDSYTPADFDYLEATDLDLGSTAPAILPVPADCAVRHLAVQGGKDGKLRLLNLADLSGHGGPGHTGGEIGEVIPVPQGGQILTAPAVWVDPADRSTWVFVANGEGIAGLRLSVGAGGVPRLAVRWQARAGGTSPIIAGGILFYAGSFAIRALDAESGRELWRDHRIGAIHWESPIVANGRVYVTDENGLLTAYAVR